MSLLSSWAIVFRTECWRLLCNQTLLLVAYPVLLPSSSSKERINSGDLLFARRMFSWDDTEECWWKAWRRKVSIAFHYLFQIPFIFQFLFPVQSCPDLFNAALGKVSVQGDRQTDRQSPAVHLLKPCLVPFRQRIHSATRWKDVTQQNNTRQSSSSSFACLYPGQRL